MLAALAAIFLLWVIALPGPADAAQRRADGVANPDQATEFSARRRYYRRYYRGYYRPYYRRYYRPYYYRPYYRGYYYRPYYYRPYYYRPYWGPRPFFYFGF
jgi:hypothetical protein